MAASLQDRFLPTFDVREHHEVEVPGPPGEAYAVLRGLDLRRSRLVRLLFGIRTLPSLLRGQPWGTPGGAFLDRVLEMGWVVLEETPGRELVAGAYTQPWAPEVRFHGLPPAELVAFDEPGFVKIVWGIAADPAGEGRSRLWTETRVLATDEESRRRFLRYWRLVSPGVRLIRWQMLRLARRELRRRAL